MVLLGGEMDWWGRVFVDGVFWATAAGPVCRANTARRSMYWPRRFGDDSLFSSL
jgi:hypothetical protein